MSQRLDRLWYGEKRPLWWLWPLAWLFRWVTRRRYRAFRAGRLGEEAGLPVIVVGNITAGGTGKSPLVLTLVARLAERGWRPVILSRGYGGDPETLPLRVQPDTPVDESGDEPAMLALASGCPVLVDPRRARAARYAREHDLGDILVCDDGLQHYGLRRDVEVAVLDAVRGLGNGAPIPVGPLREDPWRLETVDLVVTNGGNLPSWREGHEMTLEPCALVHLESGERRELAWLDGRPVLAVAGIGNPSRFFGTLRGLGARVSERPFPDHHPFTIQDLQPSAGETLVMTAKDAVKCRDQVADAWYLTVDARLPDAFWDRLDQQLSERGIRAPEPTGDDNDG